MLVTRISQFTGKKHTLDLDISQEQVSELQSPNRRNIQAICPNLSPGDREFLMTGVTPDEWEQVFGTEEP